MTATLSNCRVSAIALVILCGAPVCAEAQQFVCWPIVRGDTASGLALRLTGTTATTYSDAFQIRDPARRKFLPKSQYNRLRSDWQVCVARELATSDVPAASPAPGALAPPVTAASAALPAAWNYDLPAGLNYEDIVFAVTFGAGVSLMFLMISAVSSYAAAGPMPPALQRAGEDFLAAFATPLVDPTSAVPPVEGRLRFIPRKRRLQIYIAPNGGRRYPNLSDHKENVVYDVHRVIALIGAHRIVCDRLHAEGQWVVVSIRLKDPKEAGAT
jgi:hypothetical protein